MSQYFFSCDWGTTNFRLRLVDAGNGTVISAVQTDQGVAKVFSGWKISDADRFTYFRDVLLKCILNLTESVKSLPENTLVIISGMATSNMGMIELPYAELPVKIDGTSLVIKTVQRSADFPYPVILVSGVKTKTDLMRGEEIQVIGACQNLSSTEGLFILPGTHSKHVWVQDGKITGIKTYMTGELFQLLAVNSILSGSIEPDNDFRLPGWQNYFEEGILQSQKNDLLESLFTIRVAQLFNERTAQQNHYYLNGLLIGGELKRISDQQQELDIVLVSNEYQKKIYMTAFELLKIPATGKWMSSEKASVKGHCLIFAKACNIRN